MHTRHWKITLAIGLTLPCEYRHVDIPDVASLNNSNLKFFFSDVRTKIDNTILSTYKVKKKN